MIWLSINRLYCVAGALKFVCILSATVICLLSHFKGSSLPPMTMVAFLAQTVRAACHSFPPGPGDSSVFSVTRTLHYTPALRPLCFVAGCWALYSLWGGRLRCISESPYYVCWVFSLCSNALSLDAWLGRGASPLKSLSLSLESRISYKFLWGDFLFKFIF